MNIYEGSSPDADPARAVAEATDGWGEPDLVLVFTSPIRSPEKVAAALSVRFPAAQIVGCTTAGEHLSGTHTNGGLVAMGIQSPKLRWATSIVEQIGSADGASVRATVDALFARLDIDRETFDARRYFCLMFVDGLAGKEETLTAQLADALDGITLVGGSAGDDLAFQRTDVICGPRATSNAAVLALCECHVDFTVLKHEHFLRTPKALAVTKIEGRRVLEIDGFPAAQAYARALGIPHSRLDASIAFEHPLTFQHDRQLYVRSVQTINDDDSLTFYCAIEEGMVVSIGGREPMVASLAADLRNIQVDVMIGSNCVLRALEAQKLGAHDDLGAAIRSHAKHMIGFDTYGEQLNGLHINQTLVLLALTDKEAA